MNKIVLWILIFSKSIFLWDFSSSTRKNVSSHLLWKFLIKWEAEALISRNITRVMGAHTYIIVTITLRLLSHLYLYLNSLLSQLQLHTYTYMYTYIIVTNHNYIFTYINIFRNTYCQLLHSLTYVHMYIHTCTHTLLSQCTFLIKSTAIHKLTEFLFEEEKTVCFSPKYMYFRTLRLNLSLFLWRKFLPQREWHQRNRNEGVPSKQTIILVSL